MCGDNDGMLDGVFKPVRLPLQRFAFEIADGLPDLCDDRAIRSSMKAHRLDVRTDHAPVLAYGLAAMDRPQAATTALIFSP
jgi:hypothetical protein